MSRISAASAESAHRDQTAAASAASESALPCTAVLVHAQSCGTCRPIGDLDTIAPLSKTRFPRTKVFWATGEGLPVVEGVARRAVQGGRRDLSSLGRVEDDHVSVRARSKLALLRIQVEATGRVLQHAGQVLDRATPGQDTGSVDSGEQGAHARAEPHLGIPEVHVGPGGVGVHLTVGAQAGDRPVQDALPERIAVTVQSDRRLDLRYGALVLVIGLWCGPVEEGGKRLAEHRPASIFRSRIRSTLCQALVCTTYTGVPTSWATRAAG